MSIKIRRELKERLFASSPDESSTQTILWFIEKLSDEQSMWLNGVIHKHPEWSEKIVDNIRRKQLALEKNDTQAWNEIMNHEQIELTQMSINNEQES